ncbi:MAG: RluA family pseudouridine synthase [Bacteroidales bacterium]|jgi:23S rRNA pseudouridine1911/1915/1917 synthase|nr:RluA family pseudouridine synthase [Bacteroidales bacterium]
MVKKKEEMVNQDSEEIENESIEKNEPIETTNEGEAIEVEDEEEDEAKEGLFEHFRFLVDKGTKLLRIDKYLMNLMANTSRNKIQQASKAGCILVNDVPEKQNYKVKPHDQISILLPSEPRDHTILGEDIPLQIVYEDEAILIVNKEPGMVVHPAFANYTGTLVNALVFHFQEKTTPAGDPIQPLLVHRIDKNTSGLLIVAKTEYAQLKLAQQFFDHSIERKYCALVWGDMPEDTGTIEANVGRNPRDRTCMTVFPDGDEGKRAVTHWKVLERFGYVTLIECTLETGRTHQIRVHLKYIGHPLFNDPTYGGHRIVKGTTFTKYKQFIDNCFSLLPRHALHAKVLGVVHPVTEKFMHFEQDLPEDMNSVVEKWRNYVKFKGFEE